MGKISKKLAQRFGKSTGRSQRMKAAEIAKKIPSRRELIEEGHNPLHSAYIHAQHFTSIFAEIVSRFQELNEYAGNTGSVEDEYLPSGPPMSPLTRSYFTTWAFFDLRFGPDKETLGMCLLDLANLLGLDEAQVETIRNFQQSRMGIYEHSGRSKSRIRLRELVTGKEFLCHSTSGYQGKQGELWYVRRCPPLSTLADLGDYHLVMTTPYVLKNTSKNDWTAYLKKNLSGLADPEEALNDFLKYGPTPRHWHEFVFLSYHHSQYDAIFLTGLPDVKDSLPHAD